jgi:hypothetical protein
MAERRRFCIHRAAPERDEQELQSARALVAKTLDLLGQTAPDTFLGRKTQEPFSKAKTEKKSDDALTDREERFLKALEQRYSGFFRGGGTSKLLS